MQHHILKSRCYIVKIVAIFKIPRQKSRNNGISAFEIKLMWKVFVRMAPPIVPMKSKPFYRKKV